MVKHKGSFYIALFVAFIDLMGVGLIYPLFPAMLFDTGLPILPPETSNEMRGLWLGILLALSPLVQFFSAPVWGAYSDAKGRKKPLKLSIAIACLGYILGACGAFMNSLIFLLAGRAVVGLASGNLAIVQASIADLSTPEEKAKNFGMFSMALGAGFTFGPFFGGILSLWDYYVPFLFALFLVVINLVFAILFFKETHFLLFKRKLSWALGITHLKKAFKFVGLRAIFFCYFLHVFAWTFFFEFAPVYLIGNFGFSSSEVGVFYGTAGACYALSTGLLIRPFVKRLKPHALFFGGNLFTAISIFCVMFLPSSFWLWPLLLVICYFVAFVSPTATALVSNATPSDTQGESLGILSSLNAAAIVLSAAFSGSFIGAHPALSMQISSALMLGVAIILFAVFRRSLFQK